MTSVSHQPASVDPAISTRRTPSRKAPSPYRPSVPSKTHYSNANINAPNKLTRNNTFIAESGKSYRNGNGGEHHEQDDSGEGRLGPKAKSSSAGALEDLRQRESDDGQLVDIFKGDDIIFTGSEEDRQQALEESVPLPAMPPVVSKKSSKRTSLPVKTNSSLGRPLRSQRSVINGCDSKTIRNLLKLITRSYFESLKYEIDRMKDNDRRLQELAGSHGNSIVALISRDAEYDRRIEELREQNVRLLIETREKDKAQQTTVNTITAELNELKSVCNLLLKNIEKDYELDLLARKLRKSKQFDSNTYKMLKTQLRKPIRTKSVQSPEKSCSRAKLQQKQEVLSLPSKAKSEALLKSSKSKVSRSSAVATVVPKPTPPSQKLKSDWSSLSSMSSISTRTDMLSDIGLTSDKSRADSSKSGGNDSETAKQTALKSHKPSILKIFCCGGRSKKAKKSAKTN
ncbi:uncharacterized protein LOC120412673 isoform X1 [Culex pipiens pallens]|uniref:uncharacterized protein LOC120412673 isoform X1 n=1 Tax=Culex pipiens pallens TaxID=42434 RepID=UPI001952B589|nr:uncharacterized protein LOC120412673 isoform X1 [Culex pipiens pallens]